MSGPSDSIRVLVASFPGQGWDFGLTRHPFHAEEMPRGARYTVYNRRLMVTTFEDSSAEEGYWLLRRAAGALHTGELPLEIKGPDAERLLNKVFTGDVARLRPGRCGYQFACYPDGGMIVDGVLLRLASEHF